MSPGEAFDVIYKIAGLIGIAGIATTFLSKKLTARRSPAEIRDARVAELESARVQDHEDMKQMREEIAGLKTAVSTLSDAMVTLRAETSAREKRYTDYVHDLRLQIVTEEGPPPREWPEGLLA